MAPGSNFLSILQNRPEMFRGDKWEEEKMREFIVEKAISILKPKKADGNSLFLLSSI